MAFNLLRSLDADDIFISYSRADGSAYLTGLDTALSKRGFSCFTDKRGTDAGRVPPKTLFQKIRLCKTLVLLATPNALKEPENIAPEITEFAEANGTSRIICVSFDREKEFGDWANTPWYTHVVGKAREREALNTLKTGEPSEEVVETIVAASDYMKSKDRLRKYRNSAICVLAVLVLAIIGAAIVAGLMFRKADTQVRIAAVATDNANNARQAAAQATSDAEKALSQALAAQMEAGMAQLSAEIAKADAYEQKKLADAAADRARRAQDYAKQQQALAAQQQTVAKVRSLANSSQTLLRQRPQEIQRSLSRAAEAMQLSDSLNLHILEADTALRDNLGLLSRLRRSVKKEPETVLALSPDGRHYARNVSENKVGIYALDDDTLLKEFATTSTTIALSSDLKYAAAVTEEGIKIFDLHDDSRSRLVTIEGATAADQIALSPTGKYLVFSVIEGEDVATESSLYVVDNATGNLIKSFTDLNTKVNDITFGANGDLAVGGGFKITQGGTFVGRVLIWDVADEDKTDANLTAESLARYEAFLLDGEINAVAPGSYSFATDQGIWKQIPGATRVKRVGLMPYPPSDDTIASVKHVAFSADGTTLTLVRNIQATGDSAADNEESLEVWDTLGQEALAKVFNARSVLSIGFKPDDRVIAMTGEPTDSEPAVVFGIRDGKSSDSIVYGPTDGNVIHQSSDNSFIVSVNDNAAMVWDVWEKKQRIANFRSTLKKVEAAALSPKGDFLVLSGEAFDGWQFVVYRFDGNAYSEWKRFRNPSEPVKMMSVSADGRKLAVLHKYDTNYVRVWDVSSATEITPEALGFKREVETESFSSIPDMKLIALSPSGRLLVIADERHRTWIFDLAAGPKAGMGMLLDDTQAESLGFSADDRYLGLGSDEGVVHIFDLKNPEGVIEVAMLPHQGSVTNVVFSDDNKYVATASSDRHPYGLNEEESYPVRVWLLQPRDLLKEATVRLESLERPH